MPCFSADLHQCIFCICFHFHRYLGIRWCLSVGCLLVQESWKHINIHLPDEASSCGPDLCGGSHGRWGRSDDVEEKLSRKGDIILEITYIHVHVCERYARIAKLRDRKTKLQTSFVSPAVKMKCQSLCVNVKDLTFFCQFLM